MVDDFWTRCCFCLNSQTYKELNNKLNDVVIKSLSQIQSNIVKEICQTNINTNKACYFSKVEDKSSDFIGSILDCRQPSAEPLLWNE